MLVNKSIIIVLKRILLLGIRIFAFFLTNEYLIIRLLTHHELFLVKYQVLAHHFAVISYNGCYNSNHSVFIVHSLIYKPRKPVKRNKKLLHHHLISLIIPRVLFLSNTKFQISK